MTLIDFMQIHYQDFKELSLVLIALLAYTVFFKGYDKMINEIYNDLEEQLETKDEKIKKLNDAYAEATCDFESAVMEIERLKEQYHRCLDDYIKCAERNNQ